MHRPRDEEGIPARAQRIVGVAEPLEHLGAAFDICDIHVGELSLGDTTGAGGVDAEKHVFLGADWEEGFGLAELFVRGDSIWGFGSRACGAGRGAGGIRVGSCICGC